MQKKLRGSPSGDPLGTPPLMTKKGLKLGFWGGPKRRKIVLFWGRLNELNALKAGHFALNQALQALAANWAHRPQLGARETCARFPDYGRRTNSLKLNVMSCNVM